MMTPDFLRAAVLAALFVCVALWEQARPEWRSSVPAGRRWFSNIALYALCTGAAVALYPLRSAASAITPSVALLPSFAETRIGALAHFVTIILALDLAYYFGHRLLHMSTNLWRIHAVHHTDLDLDVTTNLRHHPLEVLLFTAIVVGVGALLGSSPGEMVGYSVLAFGVQLLAHANVALPTWAESTIGGLLVTPAFHRFHHSRDEHECHANFGEVFIFWDRLFHTAILPKTPAPAAFGVRQYLEPRYRVHPPLASHAGRDESAAGTEDGPLAPTSAHRVPAHRGTIIVS